MNWKLMLSSDVKWHPARDERLQTRAVPEKLGEGRSCLHDLLEVVDDQQNRSLPKLLDQIIENRSRARFANTELPGNERQNEFRRMNRRKRHEPDTGAVGTTSNFERQARLSNPAGAGERYQSHISTTQQFPKRANLMLPPDECGQRRWQPTRCHQRFSHFGRLSPETGVTIS